MAKVTVETTDTRYTRGGSYRWVTIALLGLSLGVVTWGLTWVIGQLVVDPLLCRGTVLDACGDRVDIAGNIAAIVTAIVGFLVLVRLHVVRPLLAVIAVLISLWGLAGWLDGLAWAEAAAWSAGLYATAYVFYTWLVRFQKILPVFIVLILVLVLVRFVTSL